LLFAGTPAELERAVNEPESDGRGRGEGNKLVGDFESAFVRFLRERGH
jgi:hypothetical protein